MMKYDEISVPSHKNIEVNQSVFGSYLWVSLPTKSVCRFLFAMFLFAGFYCIQLKELGKNIILQRFEANADPNAFAFTESRHVSFHSTTKGNFHL